MVVTWINRILFLRLLEAQLLDYNHKDADKDIYKNSEYAFLTNEKIPRYRDLRNLFFKVLAIKQEERNPALEKGFEHVPYLNSSLFLETNLEERFGLQQLDDDYEIEIYKDTVLRDSFGKKMTGKTKGLKYLLDFLRAYNFSSVKSYEDNNKLINSSVLGSFFEKLNGYKEGSFFTPSAITECMSATALEKIILQKCADQKIYADNIRELRKEIREAVKDNKISLQEINNIIGDIKIVDPAVGSGYFLVSCLNQILYLKSRLGVLLDKDGNLLDCDIEVENDELKIYYRGREYEYNFSNISNAIIQESLFLEKQKIIENCLFGVDINPNSVKICQLRLWIELLKNTY